MNLAELYPHYVRDEKFPWAPRDAVRVIVASRLLGGHRHKCSERGGGHRAARRWKQILAKRNKS